MQNDFVFEGGYVEFPPTIIKYNGKWHFHAGTRNVILGKNGSGKTTLCKCYSKVYPDVYKVKFNLKGQIGNYKLFEDNNTDNCYVSVFPQNQKEFFLGFSVKDEWNASFFKANSIPKEFANNIHSMLEIEKLKNQQPWQLSDGEKQRLAIACFLVRKNYWYIFDEWSRHLDQDWIDIVDNILAHLKENIGSGIIEMFSSPIIKKYNQIQINTEVSYDKSYKSQKLKDRYEATNSLLKTFGNVDRKDAHITLFHNGKIQKGNFKRKVQPIKTKNGEIVTILGKNGTGKTTLIKGFRVKNKFLSSNMISFSLSDPSLQLVANNINTLLRNTIKDRKKVDVELAADLLSKVLEIPKNADPLTLSIGQKKLLSTLLCALNRKKVVISDEPFTGLDEDSRLIAQKALTFAAEILNKCVIITSQSKRELDSLECKSVNI